MSFHSKSKQYQLFGVFISSKFRGVIFKKWLNDKRWYIYLESVNECPVKKISRKENFKFQIYFKSSVQSSCIWCLKSLVWFPNLSLNGVSKAPKYLFLIVCDRSFIYYIRFKAFVLKGGILVLFYNYIQSFYH